ncbi:ribokinase [Corynebacterium freneyi]
MGSANADLTVRVAALPKPGQTIAGGPLAVLPGGKSANQAATAARLGVGASFIGAVGDDPNGEMLRDALVDAGVDVAHLSKSGEATGSAMILVDDDAENCIVISPGANGTVDADLVAGHADAIRGAEVLGLCLEVGDDAVVEAARIAHEAGVTVVFNLSPVRDVPAELLELVDVLIVNEHELAALVGDAAAAEGAESGDWSDAATALAAKHGIRTAVVTLGGAGSVVVETGESDAVTATRIDPLPVDVVDTTGCGDSYMGSLMAGLASGLPVNDAARLAAAVSAYAAGGEGAQASYGTADQVRAFAETGRRG